MKRLYMGAVISCFLLWGIPAHAQSGSARYAFSVAKELSSTESVADDLFSDAKYLRGIAEFNLKWFAGEEKASQYVFFEDMLADGYYFAMFRRTDMPPGPTDPTWRTHRAVFFVVLIHCPEHSVEYMGYM